MNESLPSIQQVRERIESIQEIDPRYPKVRRVPKDACLYQIEMAHKYQFLVAGRVSEVAGKYRPEENTAFDINIKGEPGVLFAVKTAKKKTEQGFTYRGPAVPFRYEPWAKEVRDYVNDHHEPFAFQDLPATSKRTMEAASSYIFEDLNYIYRRYNKPTGNTVLDKNGKKKAEYDKIPTRWKPFSNHCLRHARTMDLKINYRFDEVIDLPSYGGWESKNVPDAMAFYLEMGLHQMSPEVIGILIQMAEFYYDKLCKYPPHLKWYQEENQ